MQEWIEGEPLSKLVKEDWSEAQARSLLSRTLQALAHIHRQGVIHRDIRSDNIIIVRAADQLPCPLALARSKI